MTVEQKIKMLLAYTGISQRELAQRIGQTPQNLNQKLKRGDMMLSELVKIAEAVGCKYESSFVFDDGTRI